MVKKREKNKFHFQSFNDQLCGVKVGVRRVGKTEECEENETLTNQSLQHWRELNCSEQFVTCYSKLSSMTESVAQLLHHRDKIVDTILESLQNTKQRHGCNAILDVLSHLFLDLQQDLYCCVPRIIPVFQKLLMVQDAALISHVFKTFAHIFKITWRQMLVDIDPVFDLLSPLFKPPTKLYVSKFAAESFAYLIRKHTDPAQMLEILEQKIDKDKDLVVPVATLLFETVKGVQYKFNTFAGPYLTLVLNKGQSSETLQCVYIEIMKLVVNKITRLETQIVWDSLLKTISEENTTSDYLIFVLTCIDILLKGGRHTYLISSHDVVTALSPVFERLGENELVLEEKLSSTVEYFIQSHIKQSKYLKQLFRTDDTLLLSQYLEHHKSVDCLERLVKNLCKIPESCDKFWPVIVEKLQGFDVGIYAHVLANITIQSEAQHILEIPQIFSQASPDFKEVLVQTFVQTCDKTLQFRLIKVIQCCQNMEEIPLSKILDTLKSGNVDREILLEIVKCVTLIAADHCVGLWNWEKVVEILRGGYDNPVVLQTVFFYLKGPGNTFITGEHLGELMDILKDNLLQTTTSIRYITLKVLSLFTNTEGVSIATAQDITAALCAETTPLTLKKYRDKIMYCSQLRFSTSAENTDFRVRYLLGSLQWSLRPVWEGLTKLIIEFANSDSASFWSIMSQVLGAVYNPKKEEKSKGCEDSVISEYVDKIANSDFSKSGPMVKEIKQNTFRVSLWNLLSSVPHIAEPKSRFWVPFILDFRGAYNAVYGFKMKDISLGNVGTPKVVSTKLDGHMHDELRAMLTLLSHANNTQALFRTSELYSMYTDLLASKQSYIQKLALECVLTYKDRSLTHYIDELLLLVDDVTFRDQLTRFSVAGTDTILKPLHRPAVFQVLLRIMFGKMGSRIGHAKGQSGAKKRQGIVLRYLEACTTEEVNLFFELVSVTFGINELHADSPPSFTITPLGMQTSYMRLLHQTISVLREDQTGPHVHHMVDTVLTLLNSVQHCLQHRTELLAHTLTPLKALRALAITTLTHVFNEFPEEDFSKQQARIYQIVVDTNIVNLPSESLQSCSPLLLFIESCATYRLSWLQHTCQDKYVLEYVISLLKGTGVTSIVISKVLTIVTCLLKQGDEGQASVLPFIQPVVEYIYGSLVSLKKNKNKNDSFLKKTLKEELSLLSRISGIITSVPDISLSTSCDALLKTVVHVLTGGIVRKTADVVNAVDTVTQLVLLLGNNQYPDYPALLQLCYDMSCDLLGKVGAKKARLALCRLYERTQHPSTEIIKLLHAWNPKVLDEPDFDSRLQGYRNMVELLSSGLSLDAMKIQLPPCLNTALYTVFSSDEMALRDSASHATLLTVEFVKSTGSNDLYTFLIKGFLVKFIQSGLRNTSELFRAEAVVLLHKVVKTFPETSPWSYLAPLADVDPEIDFFYNISHIQSHRRTRAVARLRGVVEEASPDVVWNYFLPLLNPVFSLCGNKHHNTVTEGLSTLTELCLKLPWARFRKLLQKVLKDLAAKVEDKTTVKVVGAILAGFHETVAPDSTILATLSNKILPKLQEFLTRKTTAPIARSNKMSVVYEEDQVAVQAPIAVAIVNLITRLPETERATKLPPVLLRICNTLRNRAMDVRDISRQTLSTIANNLGPLYFGYILSELKGALSKGYQLHVLAHTLHHLLLHLELKPAEIDNSTLGLVVEICVDGLVGRTAADRDRGNDKKHSLPEAKKCYSSQCLEICSSVAAVSQLAILMEPVKQMVLETTKSKTKAKLEDLLKNMVTGLLKNPLITPTVAMVFCYKLLNDSIEIEKNQTSAKRREPKTLDIYELPEAPKRDGVKPRVLQTSNVHLLHQFSLQILSTLLKRNIVSANEHSQLLDPFVDSLTVCLSSADVKTQVLTIRCFSQLFEQNVLLPKLCDNVTALTKFSFTVLRNNSRSTNSGHMLELIFSSFKILTVILREYKDFSLSDLEIKTLLQYIADDVHNRNRQATAFSLLKSILSRDIVLPEIPELLERIFEMSIVGQSDFVRTQSRQVFLHYLLHYPLGKKLRGYILSLIKQLEYTHKDGRISSLELLGMLISKLPPHILQEYFLVLFLSLATMLVSDEDGACRKGAGITIEDLVAKGGTEALKEKVWNLTSAWLADKKLKHNYLAVQLVDILSKHMSTKRAAVFVDKLVCMGNTYCVRESEDETATSTRDQIVYTGILTLLKLSNVTPLPLAVYSRLQVVMCYPHQWVRLAGAQLLGHLLAGEDSKTVLTAPFSQFFADNPRQKVNELLKSCIEQLKSSNILPEHALQIVKNFVWITSVLLHSDNADVVKGIISAQGLIHKLVTFASIESSQDPTNPLKRGIILKWVGALVNATDKSLVVPHLHSLVAPIHREITNEDSPVSDMASEVMSFLRDRLGNDVLSEALIAANKRRSEIKRKRKRETALAAIVNPDSHAKKKLKVNLAKREKKKEKYKMLKAKQFKSL